MELRRLEHFLAVADAGGFTAAADEVDVSQPALSLAVKELERELGVPLFERLGRRVILTAAGHALVSPARQALRDVATGKAAVAAVTGAHAGTLSLASLPTLAADPLAAMVGRFHLLYPGVTLDLAAPEDTADLISMVRDGRCEAGLTEVDDFPDGLVSVPVGQQALLLVLPAEPASPTGGDRPPPAAAVPICAITATAPTLALADMADVPFVAAPIGTSTRRLLDDGFAEAGVKPFVSVVTAQRDAILPLVLAGAGAALVPEPIAAVAAALGAAVRRPRPAVTRNIALIHRDGPRSPAVARFVELAIGLRG
jgi:LysR family transcriptional regulator, carnitine catabolism transcriptional activator